MSRMQKLPSEKLAEPRHPFRTVAIIAATVLVGVGASAIIGAASAPDLGREQAAVRLVGGEGKPTAPQMGHKLLLTTHVSKSEVPPPPPEPVYVAPPQQQSYSYGNYPSGWTVPFLPGTDAPDTSACASGSASTINGTPRCD